MGHKLYDFLSIYQYTKLIIYMKRVTHIRLFLFSCLLVMIMLVFPGKMQAQDDDCFAPAYQQGLALMKQSRYDDAVKFFQAALSCPTAPTGNDAQKKIEDCKRLLAEANVKLTVDNLTSVKKNAAAEGDTLSFSVSTTAASWSVIGAPAWADVKTIGAASFMVLCAKNISGSKRQAQLTVKAASKTVLVLIEQDFFVDPFSTFEVTGLSFANEDMNGNVLGEYTRLFYANDLKRIRARLTYKAQQDLDEGTVFDVRIIDPDSIQLNGQCEYTLTAPVSILSDSTSVLLPAYGQSESFSSGRYTYEVWYQARMLYSSSFQVLSGSSSEATVQDRELPLSSALGGESSSVAPSAETVAVRKRNLFESKISIDPGLNNNVVTCALIPLGIGLGFNVGEHFYLGVEGEFGLSRPSLKVARMGAYCGGLLDCRVYFSSRLSSFYLGAQLGMLYGRLGSSETSVNSYLIKNIEDYSWRYLTSSVNLINSVNVDGFAYGCNLGYRFGHSSIGLYGIIVPYYISTMYETQLEKSKSRPSAQYSLRWSIYF